MRDMRDGTRSIYKRGIGEHRASERAHIRLDLSPTGSRQRSEVTQLETMMVGRTPASEAGSSKRCACSTRRRARRTRSTNARSATRSASETSRTRSAPAKASALVPSLLLCIVKRRSRVLRRRMRQAALDKPRVHDEQLGFAILEH